MRLILLLLACLALGGCYESHVQLLAAEDLSRAVPEGDWLEVGVFQGGDPLTAQQISDFDCEPMLDGHVCLIAEDGSPRYTVNMLLRQSTSRYLLVRGMPPLYQTDEEDTTRADQVIGFSDMGGGILLAEVADVGAPAWRYALVRKTVSRRGKTTLLVKQLTCPKDTCEVPSRDALLAIARAEIAKRPFAGLENVQVFQLKSS